MAPDVKGLFIARFQRSGSTVFLIKVCSAAKAKFERDLVSGSADSAGSQSQEAILSHKLSVTKIIDEISIRSSSK